MTAYLSYTVFEDVNCTVVRNVVHAAGYEAARLMDALRTVKGHEPREGDIIALCRIDRIGSEDQAAEAAA
jgi:hypothetical protein